MLTENEVMLNVPCEVIAGDSGIGNRKRVLKGKFVKEYKDFYLFDHPKGYKECFLKSSLEQKAIAGIKVKYKN